jgi:pyroglutamyl-peptidase
MDKPIVDGEPVAYLTKLPLRRLLEALKAAGIPAIISNSAGTFGCNHIFYELMHYLDETGRDIPAGFIHVPPLPEQVVDKGTASMSVETAAQALRVVVEELTGEL